jgi:hypothetical protein
MRMALELRLTGTVSVMLGDDIPGTVVTLVHGTWARGSRWPDLERALKSGLPEPVLVRYFEWSHRNSVIERNRAAKALSEELTVTFGRYPGAYHCVIGHSHGGAVVVKALGDSNLQNRVDAVACLATPFIAAERRAIATPLLLAAVWLSPLYVLSVVPFWAIVVNPNLSPAGFTRHTYGPVVAGIAFYVLIALIWAARKYAARTGSEVLQALSYGDLTTLREKLLIMRASADEASLALTFVQAFAWLNSLAWDTVQRAASWVTRIPFGSKKRAMVSAALFLASMATGLALDAASAPAAAVLITVIPMYVAFVSSFIAIIPLSLLVPFSAVCLFPFGGLALAVNGPLLLLSAEPTPPGRWNVIQLAPLKQRKGLRHSALYQSTEAIEALMAWLRQRRG